MAVITPTWTFITMPTDARGHPRFETRTLHARVTWSDVDSSDTCTAAECGWLVDKSVQISSASGGSIAIHGSNDGSAYVVLTDPQGNDITALPGATASAIEQILENTWYIQPIATTATNAVITVFGRVPQD